jgi:hypothetical protein
MILQNSGHIQWLCGLSPESGFQDAVSGLLRAQAAPPERLAWGDDGTWLPHFCCTTPSNAPHPGPHLAVKTLSQNPSQTDGKQDEAGKARLFPAFFFIGTILAKRSE